ncbi:MAG: ATP-dependent helicase DeaD [Actinomycetota bacterium]|nr:ATP-dependent helicase DeaD [Actinomycetota bacterium]
MGRAGVTADDKDFSDLGLPGELVAGVVELGYEAPTPIQQRAIPAMLTGRDLLCQAATGTGKTAAFALPILARSGREHQGTAPTALVLAPTRELCMQVAQAVHRYGRPFGTRTLPVYGGAPIIRQISALRRGVDVVIATPGRALDLLNRRVLILDDVATVVLDEADEMLDMGFAEDIDAILSAAPAQRQTVMFSATMPKKILKIAKAHLRDPERIEIPCDVASGDGRPAVRQTAYIVARAHKVAALGRILDVESPTATLVFCRTRDEVDQLAETLNGRGYRAEGLHGGMDQAQRDRVMGRLRNGNAELLVATDVAARGLDVDHLTHVINFDVPAAPESYVHRIGRVGRAGRDGVAITIAEPREQRQLAAIERSTKQRIEIAKVPTSADLRARRLEATRDALARTCLDDDLDDYRGMLGNLTDEFPLDVVALAAVKMAHVSTVGEAGEEYIPDASISGPPARRERGDRSDRGAKPKGKGKPRGKPGVDTTRLFISAGRDAGVRPQDVVGAIANETRLSGSDVGAIEISQRFTTVDVPSDAAKDVIAALSRTRIQGNRVKVRKDRH